MTSISQTPRHDLSKDELTKMIIISLVIMIVIGALLYYLTSV